MYGHIGTYLARVYIPCGNIPYDKGEQYERKAGSSGHLRSPGSTRRLQPGREGQRIRVRLRPVGHRPATGELAGESAGEQAAQALKNIKHILDTAGSGIENVVRATIYMKNVEDFHEVDDVYAKVFIGSVKPARVAFGGNNIPKGALVEIDAIAAL